MQFMLMCGFDEARWNALAKDDRDRIMDEYASWVRKQAEAGRYLGGGKLDASDTASTIRKGSVTDGPFSEAKEQIGGFHVIECADRDAAVEIARSIPTLRAGGVIDVRPLLHRLP